MDLEARLMELVDEEEGKFPLQIIPTGLTAYGIDSPYFPKTYSGIHFVETTSLLSILPGEKPQEHITIMLDKEGEPCEDYWDSALFFESIEVGDWCKRLITELPFSYLEDLEIPYLHKDNFEGLEQVALGMMCKALLYRGASCAFSHRYYENDPWEQLISMFLDYHKILQVYATAKTGHIIHEMDAVKDVLPEYTPAYQQLYKSIMKGRNASIEEIVAAHYNIPKIEKLAREEIKECELPTDPSQETILAINEELLRLRRALI